MINLRYHIVSLAAVFLALGLGLTMGSTLLDRATVESLNNQLDSLEGQLDVRDERIDELEGRLGTLDDRVDTFAEQGVGTVVQGELSDVPVIVLAVRGTDEALVDRALGALSAADAEVAGAWWLTDRFALDDDAERRDLADALGLERDHRSLLRRTVAQRMAGMLLDRLAPVGAGAGESAATEDEALEDGGEGEGAGEAPEGGEPGTGGTDDEAVESPPEVPDEPEFFAELRASGFVEFQPVGDAGPDAVLPPAEARLVLIDGPSDTLAPDQLVEPLLEQLTSAGPVPVLLASGLPDGAAEDERGAGLDAVRADEELAGRMATLDHLDLVEGELALVFVVDALLDGGRNHFGYAETAARLLPTREPPP